jgi:hypothetical protein
MEMSAENYDRLERYLRAEMTADEAAVFEGECAADPALAQALADERNLMLAARTIRLIELKEALQAHARKGRLSGWMPLLGFMAAAAAIFLVVYIGFMRPPAFQRHAGELLRGGPAMGQGDGMERDAKALVREWQAAVGVDDRDSLGMAIEYLVDEKSAVAIGILQRYVGPDVFRQREALFFLGIAGAIQGDRAAALRDLQAYAGTPGIKFGKQAAQILQDLQ